MPILTTDPHIWEFLCKKKYKQYLLIFDMGKVTEDAIRAKLKKQIKEQFEDLEWIGIDKACVCNIDSIQPFLAKNFKYEGFGEYDFSAEIGFMVKERNNEFGSHREFYRIYPLCKMRIEESKLDFDIAIISPIYLQHTQY